MLRRVVNVVVLLTTLTSQLVSSAPSEDLIERLPDLSKQPTFKQYSGFLAGEGTKRLHYWLVESQNDPANDPLVLWLNGGPGCSSLLGLMKENGPFRIQPDGQRLEYNPFSWNTLTNVLYLEAPAGVGFSYSEDKKYGTDDDETSKNNFLALQDFFKKFPEYKKNDFYITGESYGGIYVPTLGVRVLQDASMNLKGLAIGNGYSDKKTNANSAVYLTYHHGIIGSELWEKTLTDCCPGKTYDKCDFDERRQHDEQCKIDVTKIAVKLYKAGINPYNIYAECAGGVSTSGQLNSKWSRRSWWPLSDHKDSHAKVESSLNCSNDTDLIKYLNTAEVRSALHIPTSLPKWDVCSDEVGDKYKTIYDTMGPQYHNLTAGGKLRIIVYNGDIDMVCNFLGDAWFIDSLRLGFEGERKRWFYTAADGSKQVGGFRQNYRSGVSVVTVLGAGHLVPTDRPRQALKMFTTFIKGL